MKELLARLENAKGPDRDLDRAIAETLNLKHGLYPYADFEVETAKRFTASLECAAAIIPADHDWSLHVDNGEAIAGCMPASEDGCDTADCRGASPAIALCIAALRAHAAKAKTDQCQ